MKRKTGKQLVAALFMIVTVILVMVVVFTIGEERHMFGERIKVKAYFMNVAGLNVGAPIHLAGLEVGRVQNIELSPRLDDKRIIVTLAIEDNIIKRIREDSIASITSKGLLGDKIISITIGSPGEPQVHDGSVIESTEPPDYIQFVEKGQLLLDRGAVVADELGRLAKELGNEDNIKNVNSTIASVSQIAKRIETGPGLAHTLVYDAKSARHFNGTMANVEKMSKNLNKAIAQVEKITRDIETGGGILGTLIYDKRGDALVAVLEDALKSLRGLITHVEKEDGILHTLVYESADLNFLKELNEAAAEMKKIIISIRKGEGTVGALVSDPTLYEDLKELVGNIKRNTILKSIIRYSIDQRERPKPDRGDTVKKEK